MALIEQKQVREEQVGLACLFEQDLTAAERDGEEQELRELCQAAGGIVRFFRSQRSPRPENATYFGKGFCEELAAEVAAQEVDLLVVGGELSGTQQRNLERTVGCPVVDRTRLILDIFARRARSGQGKLQVELAQLLYLMPRLTGQGHALSRLGGGIGTRGPGETQLETDRRTIRSRIARLRQDIRDLEKTRHTQPTGRRQGPLPLVALVGYTSAGKSTLFRTLTAQDCFISPELFATLDPLVRRVPLRDPQGGEGRLYACLTDTVGFVRRMPPVLMDAFSATLAEVVEADLVLHVVDAHRDDRAERQADVEGILKRIGVAEERIWTLANQVDLLPPEARPVASPGFFPVSALTGEGLPALKRAVEERFFSDYRIQTWVIPQRTVNWDLMGRWAVLLGRDRVPEGWRITLAAPRSHLLSYRNKYPEVSVCDQED